MVNSVPPIRTNGLTVIRGKERVLADFDLEIEPGTLTGLLGPSGSGKSTLLRAIVGVQRLAGGRVEVLGLPAGSPLLRRRLAYVTQAPSIYGDLTVRQNLRYFARLLDTSRAAVDRAIELVGFDSHSEALVGHLSGGQRSRASLATALLGGPELLVLDEPTVGLDPLLRRDLWTLFNQLAEEGTTLLISSHVMDEAERCPRLILLRHGEILAHDTVAGVLDRTGAADATEAFLSLIDEGESP